ncbi:MAG: acyltransferase family protein [Chitinophagaceae bacterium]|nr:acyltransferase family protein [Chitinophagaceae bacterium]
MNSNQNRIYSLDSLRAWLMLLGIVYHGGYFTYSYIDEDSFARLVFYFITEVVHSFRMPLFFVLSGFLILLFYKKKGIRKTVENRFARIVIPFVAAMVFLMPFKKYACNVYASVVNGNTVLYSIQNNLNIKSFIPETTDYLWFLVYLTWFIGCFLFIIYVKARLLLGHDKILYFFNGIITSLPKRILFFTCLTLLGSLLTKSHDYYPSLTLIPDLKSFILFFTYFAIGVLLYKSQIDLKLFAIRCRQQILLGVILIICNRFLLSSSLGPTTFVKETIVAVLTILSTQLFLFGFLGLFVKYFSKPSAKARYISNSSYWIYLIHMVIMPVIPILLLNFCLPQVVVYFINVIVTFLISLVTYHYFVRPTFIGFILNGRIASFKIEDDIKKNIKKGEEDKKYDDMVST